MGSLTNIFVNCETCKKEFKVWPSYLKRGTGKFCSRKCFGIYHGQHFHPSEEFKKKLSESNKGRKVSLETRIKMSVGIKKAYKEGRIVSHFKGCTPWNKGKEFLTNEKHPQWKGEKVGYNALHRWIRRHRGNPPQCIECGVRGEHLIDGRWSIHWANVDSLYKRNLKDYVGLCYPCHGQYDSERRMK